MNTMSENINNKFTERKNINSIIIVGTYFDNGVVD